MRTYNFCAGPATMPVEVLEQAQQELLSWKGLGASVMEISHRSKEFVEVVESCEANLRELLDIPVNYRVLFLQGGAYAQFEIAAMNLLGDKNQIDFIDTGIWSSKAISACKKHAKTNIIYSTKNNQYRSIPKEYELHFSDESAYVHFCANETINGVEFPYDLGSSSIPVVVDMSSNILSKKIDVNKYGMIYAGAQKNIGPAGLTLVIVREDLLGRAVTYTPDVFNYTIQAENHSMLNTPPTFAIYLMHLILENLKVKGGIEVVEKSNYKKAFMLYNAIDKSELYVNPVDVDARSRMNIPFVLKDAKLDKLFLKEAAAEGLINLGGHRSVGGMRASIYNAMPIEGVMKLTDFMMRFEHKYL